jgi:hypothetical protein
MAVPLWLRLSKNNVEKNVSNIIQVAVFAVIKCSQ